MEEKIYEYYNHRYSSSPVPIDEDKVVILIEHDCECDYCGKSIFELDDFPEILKEKDEVLCEDCYDEKYRDICPVCEDYYLIEDVKEGNFPKFPFFYYNPYDKDDDKTDYTENYKQPSGVYEAKIGPVFISAVGGIGDCWIQWDNLQLICTSDELLSEHPKYKDFFSGDDLKAQFVCDSCWLDAERIRDKKLKV